MTRARRGVLLASVALVACPSSAPTPASVDTRHDACSWCRMTVSDVRFASQVVAPGELPRFFDDLGCVAAFVKAGRTPQDATVFVADHRTKQWLRADGATYTRQSGLATPMGSHVLAHSDAASRDLDPDARGGNPVPFEELFGGKAGAAGGKP